MVGDSIIMTKSAVISCITTRCLKNVNQMIRNHHLQGWRTKTTPFTRSHSYAAPAEAVVRRSGTPSPPSSIQFTRIVKVLSTLVSKYLHILLLIEGALVHNEERILNLDPVLPIETVGVQVHLDGNVPKLESPAGKLKLPWVSSILLRVQPGKVHNILMWREQESHYRTAPKFFYQ